MPATPNERANRKWFGLFFSHACQCTQVKQVNTRAPPELVYEDWWGGGLLGQGPKISVGRSQCICVLCRIGPHRVRKTKAVCTSQARNQKERFAILEVAADWYELMILQRIIGSRALSFSDHYCQSTCRNVILSFCLSVVSLKCIFSGNSCRNCTKF